MATRPGAPAAGANGGAAIALNIDSLLSKHAKNLRPGETITLTLVKGPTSSTVDPLLARAASAGKTAQPDCHPFPRVAKFIETVERPNFAPGGRFAEGRMYEEDAPKVKDESDDEDESDNPNRPKKKRWRRNEPPRRHWVLQEKSEFVEKMSAKRRRRVGGPSPAEEGEKLSTRYEGTHEANPSHYVLLSIAPPPDAGSGEAAPPKPTEGTVRPPHVVSVLPVHGFHSFAQPAKFATLSMHEAERAITDQRNNMTRYMMHGKMSETSGAKAELMAEKAGGGQKKGGLAKARLLGRLSAKEAGDEDDDIMGDLAFRERKGGSVKARKELLNTLGDGGLTVDEDGVLGGTNDAEFGGRRRFGKLAAPGKKQDEGKGKKGKDDDDQLKSKNSATGGAGNDGLAMDEDFYQRDVGAEYDEMDYDANEQFDDDDVDVGEREVEVDGEGGFAAEHEDDDDFDDDEYDEDDLANAMASGLASAAGTKFLIAKARGEAVEEVAAVPGAADGKDGAAAAGAGGADQKEGEKAADGKEKNDSLAKVIAGAEKAKQEAEEKRKAKQEAEKAKAEGKADMPKAPAVEFDENGQRIITLDAVRREIWLHHGAITTKRLMKIFDIKKKASAARQNKFREVVKELCTMKIDNVDGNMLVLKQHYSKMG